MAKYYSYPTDFEKLIYATQLMQARAIRTAVEHFRRNRGRCMGAIYWQLNDCWPVASWSSIDYEGRPKAMYYAAKKFFAPVLLSANIETDKITLNVSNEKRRAFEGTVVWRLKDTALDILWEKKKDICVSSLSAADIAVIESAEIPEQRMRDSFIEYELYSKDGELISSANCLPVRPKAFRYPEVKPDIRVRKLGDGRFMLTLLSDVFVRKICVCSKDVAIGEIDDRFFDITSKEPVSVEIATEDINVTEKELSDSLYILSESDLV